MSASLLLVASTVRFRASHIRKSRVRRTEERVTGAITWMKTPTLTALRLRGTWAVNAEAPTPSNFGGYQMDPDGWEAQQELLAIIDKMKAWDPTEFDAEQAIQEWDEYVAYGIACFEKLLELQA